MYNTYNDRICSDFVALKLKPFVCKSTDSERKHSIFLLEGKVNTIYKILYIINSKPAMKWDVNLCREILFCVESHVFVSEEIKSK